MSSFAENIICVIIAWRDSPTEYKLETRRQSGGIQSADHLKTNQDQTTTNKPSNMTPFALSVFFLFAVLFGLATAAAIEGPPSISEVIFKIIEFLAQMEKEKREGGF